MAVTQFLGSCLFRGMGAYLHPLQGSCWDLGLWGALQIIGRAPPAHALPTSGLCSSSSLPSHLLHQPSPPKNASPCPIQLSTIRQSGQPLSCEALVQSPGLILRTCKEALWYGYDTPCWWRATDNSSGLGSMAAKRIFFRS